MGALLSFFTAGPARIKGLVIGAGVMAIAVLALTSWALLERALRFQALADVERVRTALVRERDQVKVLADAVAACSAGVDQAKRVGEAALAGTAELVAAAKRLKAPPIHTREVIEKIIEKPVTSEQAADCNWGWNEIEDEHRKRKARAP